MCSIQFEVSAGGGSPFVPNRDPQILSTIELPVGSLYHPSGGSLPIAAAWTDAHGSRSHRYLRPITVPPCWNFLLM
ncbi:hypothetical protein TNCV_2163231 [Trichonephila clavipes]|nr:hypothetical protein TNCV_2163231 [Trichonephila clavipes]